MGLGARERLAKGCCECAAGGWAATSATHIEHACSYRHLRMVSPPQVPNGCEARPHADHELCAGAPGFATS